MKVNLSWISKTAKNKRSGYYKDSDDFSDLPQEKILAVCAFSFYGDKRKAQMKKISKHHKKTVRN